ncbi:1589_t:CDS:2 [Ambispora leptoticha]|uniref:1589_t:CDS:1 n=1 Tax=Ambispora leptoticha TaxID=144679 RepID=A0A9N9FH44_9GLOM|nr:1589_t:CDS:2 [Ambispora leptoticha]
MVSFTPVTSSSANENNQMATNDNSTTITSSTSTTTLLEQQSLRPPQEDSNNEIEDGDDYRRERINQENLQLVSRDENESPNHSRNEETPRNYTAATTTIINNTFNTLTPPTPPALPRRKSSVLDISSLLCDFASASVASPVSDASYDDDKDVMDGVSTRENESFVGSQQNQPFNNGRSAPFTPANSPPLSDDNKTSITTKPTLRMSEDHSSNGPLVLPPIRSFASSWTPLDQFAAISEAVRSDSQRSLKSPRLVKPEADLSLSSSPEDGHRYQQQHVSSKNNAGGNSQEHEREHLLRRSSFDTSQMRFSPLAPSALNPFATRLPPASFLERRHSDSPAAQGRNLEASRVTSPGSSYSTYGAGVYPANANTNSNNGNGYASTSHMSMPQHLPSPYHDPSNGTSMVKAKRKRANANQLKVLNEVFQHTFFPSTELRIQLGKQLGMSPRTVQIWFQNKRQSWRSKTRASATNGGAQGDDDQGMNPEEMDTNDDNNNNGGSTGNDHNMGRRSSNSSMSSSDEEEQDQRSVPDSPLDSSSSYYRNNGVDDYFSRSQINSSSESINGTSTYSQLQQHNHHQQNYHSSPSSSSIHQNEDYFHSSHHGYVSGSNISNSSSPLSPPSLLNHKSNNERLPNIVSSFSTPTAAVPSTTNGQNAFMQLEGLYNLSRTANGDNTASKEYHHVGKYIIEAATDSATIPFIFL